MINRLQELNTEKIEKIIIVDSNNNGYRREYLPDQKMKEIVKIMNSTSYKYIGKSKKESGGWSKSIEFKMKNEDNIKIYFKGNDIVIKDYIYSPENQNISVKIHDFLYRE